jgi:hypothetical protein
MPPASPLLRRALLVTLVVIHVLAVLAPADVLAPVDPWEIGRKVWRGAIPYRDFGFEYPPGAILAFLLPGAVPKDLATTVLALQAVAAEVAVVLLLRRFDGALWRWVPFSILLFPFLAGGFDALPMAAIAWSTALLAAGAGSGWWVAATGAAVKLVPGGSWVWGRHALWHAVVALVVVVPVLLAPSLLARHPDDAYLGYTLHRGVQVESVAATTTWLGHRLSGQDSTFEYRFKAFEIEGAGKVAAGWALLGLAGLGVVALGARRADADPWLASFTTILLLMISSKVLSPQFVAWPAPLAVVLGGRWFGAWLLVVGLTLVAYLGEGPTWILTFALIRNLVLLAVAGTGLRELIRTRRLRSRVG